MITRLAIALLLIALMPFPAPQASANTASIESRLTITFTQTEVGSGSTRQVIQTVTVTDSMAGLTQGVATGSQIRIVLTTLFCVTPRAAMEPGSRDSPAGCRPTIAPSIRALSPSSFQQTRTIPAANIDPYLAAYPVVTHRLLAKDSRGTLVAFFANYAPPGAGSTGGDSEHSPQVLPVLNLADIKPVATGETLNLHGERLDGISAVSIGSLPVSLSSQSEGNLTIATPAELSPGLYDLTIRSKSGSLTHINAIRIKAPTPTKSLTLKVSGGYLNESVVGALSNFHNVLSSDYEKVRCIVNASDGVTAGRIADLVCAQVTRAEIRNVEVVKEIRTNFKGRGFWVRVYAVG